LDSKKTGEKMIREFQCDRPQKRGGSRVGTREKEMFDRKGDGDRQHWGTERPPYERWPIWGEMGGLSATRDPRVGGGREGYFYMTKKSSGIEPLKVSMGEKIKKRT